MRGLEGQAEGLGLRSGATREPRTGVSSVGRVRMG